MDELRRKEVLKKWTSASKIGPGQQHGHVLPEVAINLVAVIAGDLVRDEIKRRLEAMLRP